MLKNVFYIVLSAIFPFFAFAQSDTTSLFQFSTSDLLALPPDVLDVQVTTSSKNAESLRDAMATLTVVSGYEIEGYGASSVRDVLDRVVGTYVTGSYFMPNNIISIRGDVTNGFNSHVLVLLDGRPIRENLFNGFNSVIYSGIPLSSIERIEVVRGPGSVLYGTSAFTGVINIILKEGKKQQTYATQTVGSFRTVVSELGTGFDKGRFKFSTNFRLMNSKGWDFQMYDHDRELINEKAGDRAVSATLQTSYGGFRLSSFVGVNRNNNFAEGDLIKNQPYREVENTRFFTNLAYQKELTKWWTISFNLTYNRSRFYEDINLPTSERRGNYHDAFSTDLLTEVYSYFKPVKNLNIILGGLVNNARGNFKQSHLTADDEEYDYSLGAINHNPRVSIPLYSSVSYSGYFQVDYTLREKLKVLLGAQYNQANDKQSFVPRAGLLYKASPNWTGKLMYGEAFRDGSGYERLSTEDEAYGDPDLNPELIRTLETNLTYTTSKRKVAISLTAYLSWATDLIRLSNPDEKLFYYFTGESIPIYINSSALQYHGVELEGKYTLSKHWQLDNSIILQDVVQEVYDGILKQATGIPQLMFKIGLLHKNPKNGFSASMYYSYFSRVSPLNKYTVEGKVYHLFPKMYNPNPDAYHYLTLQTSIEVRSFFNINNIPSTTFSVFVQNALNQTIYYADYGKSEVNSVAGRGRRGIYGKLSVKF
jgi:outer membrane cobalamin receptor